MYLAILPLCLAQCARAWQPTAILSCCPTLCSQLFFQFFIWCGCFILFYFTLSLKIYFMKSGMLKYPRYYNIPYNIEIYFNFLWYLVDTSRNVTGATFPVIAFRWVFALRYIICLWVLSLDIEDDKIFRILYYPQHQKYHCFSF